jgi:hypothetical protein
LRTELQYAADAKKNSTIRFEWVAVGEQTGAPENAGRDALQSEQRRFRYSHCRAVRSPVISRKGITEMRFLKPQAATALRPLTLALLALSLGTAQTVPKDMISLTIKDVDAKTLRLRSKEGKEYVFALGDHTVYCQGARKVWDWTYLKKMAGRDNAGKDNTVTLKVAKDFKSVLVVWDQRPSTITQAGTPANGTESLDFPPMCK